MRKGPQDSHMLENIGQKHAYRKQCWPHCLCIYFSQSYVAYISSSFTGLQFILPHVILLIYSLCSVWEFKFMCILCWGSLNWHKNILASHKKKRAILLLFKKRNWSVEILYGLNKYIKSGIVPSCSDCRPRAISLLIQVHMLHFGQVGNIWISFIGGIFYHINI